MSGESAAPDEKKDAGSGRPNYGYDEFGRRVQPNEGHAGGAEEAPLQTPKFEFADIEAVFHHLLLKAKKIDVDKCAAPKEPVGAGEVVIGVIESVALRQLWLCSCELRTATRIGHLQLETKAKDSVEYAELWRELQITTMQAEVVQQLFWLCIRKAYELPVDHDTIGLKEGWKVIASMSEQIHPLQALGGLFGGMEIGTVGDLMRELKGRGR